MCFLNKLFNLILVIIALFSLSCQKRSNYEGKTYWITKQAGVYEIQELHYYEYQNEKLFKDEVMQTGNSTFVLKTIEMEGQTAFKLEVYGTHSPIFLNYPNYGFGWSTEGDNKRLTFGIDKPGVGYTPTASLTVDKMGKKNQIWNYIINSQVGSNNIYKRYEYKVSRK